MGFGIGVAHWIVEFFFLGVDDDIIIGQLAKIDFRTGDGQFLHSSRRGDVLDPQFRLTLAGDLIDRRHHSAITVCILQILIDPSLSTVLQAGLIKLTGRHEDLFGLTIDIITIDIHINEFVIQPHALQLIEDLRGWAVVSDADIAHRVFFFLQIADRQRPVSRIFDLADLVQTIGFVGQFNIALDVGLLFADLSGFDHHALYQAAARCADYEDDGQQNRAGERQLEITFLHTQKDGNDGNDADHTGDIIHRQGDLEIYITCALSHTAAGIEQIGCLQLEADDEEHQKRHQEIYDAFG